MKQSNISGIMDRCREIDKEKVTRHNERIQDEQLCESIKSVDFKGILMETNSNCSSSKSDEPDEAIIQAADIEAGIVRVPAAF